MIKKLLFGFSLLLSCPAALLAQRNCGTMSYLDNLERQYPGTKARMEQNDHLLEKLQNQHAVSKTTASVVTIPVVVHVVYRSNIQNISQAQIESQIDVLNEDFSRTNADAVNTPNAFKPLAGDMQIRFELAKRDPNGDPTTGITRTQTTSNSFGLDDAMKFTARGGHDAWDRDKYLNIWVCNIGGGILGYAQFPGSGPKRTDGVVIGYNYFGRTGTLSPGYNKGRTTTHEVGHWLGLYHIWGDEPGCSNDDKVNDTPLQKGENFGCPSFPQTTGSGGSCAAGSPGSMFMNYMDYVDDACMNMFSKGQVTRAQNILQTLRPAILTSQGATAIVVKSLDASVFKIESPLENTCDPNVQPKVILKNRGSQPLTSATITYTLDNGPAQTYSWKGNLASFASETIVLPASRVSFGNRTLQVSVSSPNGQTDNDPTNDTQTLNFTVTELKAGLALPFSESFEEPTFPPQGWVRENPDAEFTWQRTRRAATGSYSAYINNYDYEYIGETDELQMPALNLSALTEPKLEFKVAYAATAYGKYADTLEVLASRDCGVSFTSIYKKSGRELASISNTIGSPFLPTTSQWRTDSVSLESFGNDKNVILKFRNITGYENNLYLDDINVTGKAPKPQPEPEPEPEPEPTPKPFVIFPNPTAGQLTLAMENGSNAEATIILMNSIGQAVINRKLTPVEGKIFLNLTGKSDGIYHLQVISEGKTHKQKIVLNQILSR